MTQLQLDRAVAHATDESPATIHRLGFQLQGDDLEPEDLHLAVDCPFCGRSCSLPEGPVEPGTLAECDRCDVYFDLRPEDVYASGPEAITPDSTSETGEVAA